MHSRPYQIRSHTCLMWLSVLGISQDEISKRAKVVPLPKEGDRRDVSSNVVIDVLMVLCIKEIVH